MISTYSLVRSSRPLLCISTRSLSNADRVSLISKPFTSGPSTLLSSALNQKQAGSHTVNKEDSVGPFQLGISQAALRRGEKAKKWSELSMGGKVVRTTQRTTNMAVILLGAGLSAVLVYALTSELFSKNSPTVLYNDACKRIKTSPKVARYLHSPLAFHNNPPSSLRPRHRHRRVASQVAVDSFGREHMLLNFYVQGSSTVQTGDDKGNQWNNFANSLTSMTLEDIKEKTTPFIDSARSAFKYLRGDAIRAVTVATPDREKNKERERSEEQTWWGLTGLFSGLRGRGIHEGGGYGAGTNWTEGEVHADLVRNDEGYFVFRYLLIDIPNSENRNPIRVFVERAAGVRENEPITRFHSS